MKKVDKAICEGGFLMNEVYTTELLGLGADKEKKKGQLN